MGKNPDLRPSARVPLPWTMHDHLQSTDLRSPIKMFIDVADKSTLLVV